MFEYIVSLDDDDYCEFCRYHNLYSPIGKKYLQIIRLMIPGIFVVGLMISLLVYKDAFS